MARDRQEENEQTGHLPPAAAQGLKGLAGVAPGAIVSRTLAQGPAGGLTFFAFDAGQALSEHTAPFDAYVLVVEGEAELTIGGRLVLAREGDLTLMPAGVPHALRARTPMKMLLTMLRA